MYHTSPTEITEIKDSVFGGCAGDCLFFSDSIYKMTASPEFYVYEAHFNCVDVSELWDEEIINEIAQEFGVDLDTAESLLDGSQHESDYSNDVEKSYWLQGMRGQCGKKMGFDGCEDTDEQGAVYIVPMLGREDDLKLLEIMKNIYL